MIPSWRKQNRVLRVLLLLFSILAPVSFYWSEVGDELKSLSSYANLAFLAQWGDAINREKVSVTLAFFALCTMVIGMTLWDNRKKTITLNSAMMSGGSSAFPKDEVVVLYLRSFETSKRASEGQLRAIIRPTFAGLKSFM